MPRFAGADPGHQFVEIGDLPVAETEFRPDADDFFGGAGKEAFAVLESEICGDVIARFGRPAKGHQAAAIGQHVVQGLVHVGIGNFADRFFDLQPLPFGQCEFRPNFQIEFEGQRAFGRHFHRVEIQIGLADGRDFLLFVYLGQAVAKQQGLDLFGHVLAKSGFDQFARRPARAETGNLRRGHEIGKFLVEVAFDVLARNGHLDVTFAGAAVLNIDGEIQRLLSLPPFPRRFLRREVARISKSRRPNRVFLFQP